MPKLAQLPGGVAVNPEQVLYLRAGADTSQGTGDDAPHSIFLRIQGFNQPAPLARHPNRAAAEAAMSDLKDAMDAATDGGDAEMVLLPRGIAVKTEEMVYVEVIREKTAAGPTYVVRTKLESEDRPIELATFADASDAVALSKGCADALGEDFVHLSGGLTIRNRKVQRIEVVADRNPSQLLFRAVVKCQSEPRRLTIGMSPDRAKIEAIAEKARAAINEVTDEDEHLAPLGLGFSIRPDGLKGLRVRAQRVTAGGAQKTVFQVVLLTDDDEEQPFSVVETGEEAEALVKTSVEAFNAAQPSDDDDDWD